ncbi:thioredoxin [Naegleria gruberi]|uniref:Thioredoxin n=1 Tax=Naegleria gruberi TaxID=5762 RepID=D2UX78_NAEGR|nr:thioredoxin [Naegleria gruberi]EFC50881.1 thioredoxin [Naegleria gruberi]|eukprot:XP_002683625.1 thioredoxin [Naegleria gruberi]
MAQHIHSPQEFNQVLSSSSTAAKVVMADFYANWCSPCRQIAPTVEQLATQYQHCINVVKVNVDHHDELADKYHVNQMPSFIFLKDGKVVDRFIGNNPTMLREAMQKNCFTN